MYSEVANILFSELTIDVTLRHNSVQLLANTGTLLTAHRTIIPYYWSAKMEWLVVIVDNSMKEIHIVYPRYVSPIEAAISALDRDKQNQLIVTKIKAVLDISVMPATQMATAAEKTNSMSLSWKIICSDPEVATINIPKACSRTPCHMEGCINNKQDSGLYISYAIECDYYDVPIYANLDDWENFRLKLVYYLLNNDLPHME